MATLTMKELLEAGVHFGHQTKRWNPKMQKYIFGERNGIYIIDLQKTLKKFREAYAFVRDLAADGGIVLFVGTKKQAQETVLEETTRCGQFYVNHRWLGGTLTNFTTIRKSIARLKKLDEMSETGEYERLPKKEVIGLERERAKLAEHAGRHQEHGPAALRGLHHRSQEGDDRGGGGPSPVHPDRGHRGHQLRSLRDRLPGAGQRRRDPVGAPDHLAHRGRDHRGAAAASPSRRPRRRSRPRRTCRW